MKPYFEEHFSHVDPFSNLPPSLTSPPEDRGRRQRGDDKKEEDIRMAIIYETKR